MKFVIKIHPMQNNVFVAMCNSVGKEGDMDFAGESIVVNPNGDVVAKADNKEQIIYADIDINEVYKCRNERTDVYSKICDKNTDVFKYSLDKQQYFNGDVFSYYIR
jgi:predicted amidohydrolase